MDGVQDLKNLMSLEMDCEDILQKEAKSSIDFGIEGSVKHGNIMNEAQSPEVPYSPQVSTKKFQESQSDATLTTLHINFLKPDDSISVAGTKMYWKAELVSAWASLRFRDIEVNRPAGTIFRPGDEVFVSSKLRVRQRGNHLFYLEYSHKTLKIRMGVLSCLWMKVLLSRAITCTRYSGFRRSSSLATFQMEDTLIARNLCFKKLHHLQNHCF